jgi:hypothetical protein
MRSRSGLARIALLVLLPTSGAAAFEQDPRELPSVSAVPDPTQLGESWFDRLHGFDALLAFESKRGPVRTSLLVARRWVEGRAQLIIDILLPRVFEDWAFMLLHNYDRSDDLFVYVPWLKRVRRISSIEIEKELLFEVMPIGELRPITFGEMEYEMLGEEQVAGEPCWLIEARPLHRGLGHSRVVLAISKHSGFALRTEFYRGERIGRRVLIDPGDMDLYGDRLLPRRLLIETPPSPGATELTLHNALVDPVLPDRLFTKHNLRVQRFPHF